MGAWFFREGSPDAIRTALKWDPANPKYYDALGTLMHLYANDGDSNEIVRLHEKATRLSPQDAEFWADLGAAYDWAGRSKDALGAFQRAQELFPHSSKIHWRLANFYVRSGNIPGALLNLRAVLSEDATSAGKVFALATKATRDRQAVLDMLPPRAPVFFDFLNFQIEKGDLAGAEEVWARILKLDAPFDLRETFPYVDALIQHREFGPLSDTWSGLARRFPGQVQAIISDSNLIKNGDFEYPILNGAFDWRVIPTEGAVVSVDSARLPWGAHALRITFDGARNVDYGNVIQYVLVQPHTRYRFSAHTRVEGITTDSGPRFQLCDPYNGGLLASTENLVGTSGWEEQSAKFRTLSDTHLLMLKVVRPPSEKWDSHIGGTVWISGVRLNSE